VLAIYLEPLLRGAEGRHIGPIDGVRLDGVSLKALPLNVEMLRLAGDQWRASEDSFAGLVIKTLTLVYAERSRRTKGIFYGPFELIRIDRAVIYTSRGDRRTFACFNSIDGDWHICADGTNWPSLILLPCSHRDTSS
jgi:hypothetical protein